MPKETQCPPSGDQEETSCLRDVKPSEGSIARAFGGLLPRSPITRGKLRAFAPVVGRALLFGFGICSVAWLGQKAEPQTVYGAERPVQQAAAHQSDRSSDRPSDTSKSDGQTQGERQLAQSARPGASTSQKPAEPPAKEKAPTPCGEEGVKRQSAIFEDGRVILNEATVAELSTLKGVGEKRAQAIVDLREKLGGFKKSSDLLRIRGIGWKSLQKLKAAVVVDRPEAPSPKEPSQEPES